MKTANWIPALTVISCVLLGTACSDKEEDKNQSTTDSEQSMVNDKEVDEKFSYMIGFDTGKHIKNMPIEFDVNEFVKGVKAAHKGDESKINEEESKAIRQKLSTRFQEHQEKMIEKQEEEHKALAEKNESAGAAFLAENKKKENVKETESGLQYVVKEQGSGTKPKESDKVEVHYRGTLIDGTEFDSSHKRGKPTTFTLNQVIPGWTEGLKLMKEGSKFTFFIPANLAYGEQGAGNKIPPNSTLIFDVELLKIIK